MIADRLFERPNFNRNVKISDMNLNWKAEEIKVNYNQINRNRSSSLFRLLKWKKPQRNGENSYFQEMKPMFYTLRVFGRFPFSIKKGKIQPFKFVSFPVVYTILFYLLQTSFTSIAFLHLFIDKLTKNSDFDQFIFWTSVLTFLGQNFVVPCTYWMDFPKILKYIVRWDNFQECSRKYVKEDRKKFSLIIFWVSLLNFPFCFLFIQLQLNILGDLNAFFFASFSCVLISSLTLMIIWCASLQKIRCYSDLLLDLIKKATQRMHHNHRLSVDQIRHARRLWLDLSELTTGLGYSITNSAMSVNCSLFISFVLSTYGFISILFISDKTTRSHFGLIIISTVTFTCTFIIYNAAHRTVDKVGCKFILAISKIEVEAPLPCAKALRQLLRTIKDNPPVIHFSGYLSINRRLLVSFVSNTVTYLIVLIQFKTTVPLTKSEGGLINY